MNERQILQELAHRIRRERESRDWSLAEVAERSGLSRRYLTEAEAGRANLSILKLAQIARALRMELKDLCDLDVSRSNAHRIALIGLRGAGKSTIGRRLAMELEVPFVELDQKITERTDMSLEQIFSLHGDAYYRRMERDALEEHLASHGASVLATGGSLVTHAETYDRLRATSYVVWLRAQPEDHWNRTLQQGDLRPMRHHPDAMKELRAILAQRTPLYERADLIVDTSADNIESAVKKISTAVAPH